MRWSIVELLIFELISETGRDTTLVAAIAVTLFSVRPDLAKHRHFGKILTIDLVVDKISNIVLSNFYAVGRIMIVANGLILNK